MRLYGLLEQLTKIILVNGKNIEITPDPQTGSSDKVLKIPAMGDTAELATQEIVLANQPQTLKNKTLDASLNSISNIVNANVKADAAIAGTKISPDFGSQNVTTSGTISTTGAGSILAAGLMRTTNKLEVKVSTPAEAVYIEQLGAGNALVVTDSADPDSTTTVISGAGDVGIGVSAGATLTEKLTVAGSIKVETGNVLVDTEKGLENASASGKLYIGNGANTQQVKLGTGGNVNLVEIGTGDTNKTITIGADGDTVQLPGGLLLGSASALTIGDNGDTITIPGNLVVQGTTTTIDTTNLEVKDKNILLNNGGTTASAAGAGISIEGDANAVIASVQYDAALASKFKLGAASSESEVITKDASQTLLSKKISSTASLTGALELPAGTQGERPGTPVEGMIRYNSDSDSFEGYAAGAWAGIGGSGTVDKITQAYVAPETAFAVGEVLYLDGAVYKRAKADAANTAEVVGVVSRIVDATPASFTFEMTLSGEVSGLSGLTAGEVYFLSASTAGALTVTEPSVVGQVSLPVGVASSTTSLYVAPKRGVVVGAANARTTIAVSNNSATNVVSVTNYNSLKLEGELNVTRSSGGNQRAYYTVEAAKNGAGVWQVSASYTGDDVLYTTLPSWDVASNNLQVTMPLVTNFSSASLTYSLNAPAVGASLPLAIDSSSLNIVADAPLSYRNRIINGAMQISQRYGATEYLSANGYSVDRFATRPFSSPTGVFKAQQVTDAPTGFNYSLKVTCTTAQTSLNTTAGTQGFGITQMIEGFNVGDFDLGTVQAKTFTFSFWVKSSQAGVFSLCLSNGAQDRAYGVAVTINAVNTWEYKTITITGDTTGTWLKDNGGGLQVIWGLGAATGRIITENAWSTGVAGPLTPLRVSGQTINIVETVGASFQVTGVQLEVGSKASAFERRPYGMELQMAMRYYTLLPNQIGITSELGRFLVTIPPVPMRVTPTIIIDRLYNGETGITLGSNVVVTANPGGSGYTATGYGNLLWRGAENLRYSAEL